MDKNEESVSKLIAEGEKWMERKLYDRAMIEFNKALQIDMEKASAELQDLYQRCLSSGDYAGVIAVGSNLLQKIPNNIEIANIIGNAYRKTENFHQAEKLYEYCLNIDPEAKEANYNLAATLARADLYDNSVSSAISEFESMTTFKLPDNEEGENQLLEIQKEMFQEQELLEIQKEIDQEQQPEKSEEGGDGSKEGDAAKLLEALRDSSEGDGSKEGEQKDQDNEEGEESGDNEEEKKEPEEPEIVPEMVFNKLRKERTPEGKKLLLSLGFYCLQHGPHQIAWRIFTRLSGQDPENEDLKCFLTLSYVLRNEEELAIEELIVLLGKNPYHRYANVNLGYIYKLQNNLLLARKYFIITHELVTKSQGYYDMQEFRALGDSYYNEAAYKKALEVYEVILSEVETVDLMVKVGKSYLEMKEYNDALISFKQILKLDPKNKESRNALRQMNAKFISESAVLKADNKFARASELLEMSMEIEAKLETLQELISLYELLKDKEKLKVAKEKLRIMEAEHKKQELDQHRLQKLKKAKNYEEHHLFHKAIRTYEEALRLQADKRVFQRLVTLYKRTKQLGMVEELTQRFNKMVEHERRMIQYEREAERRRKAMEEDGEEEEENTQSDSAGENADSGKNEGKEKNE